MAGIRKSVAGLLGQKGALLRTLKIAQYTSPMAIAGNASVGQHIRHALDHYRKALAVGQQFQDTELRIEYDVRDRGTNVETDLQAAQREIADLTRQVEELPEGCLTKPVTAIFMLSAEGEQQPLQSTLGRELGFCVHHAIHHCAMIKVMLDNTEPRPVLPEGFGLAPSTAQSQMSR